MPFLEFLFSPQAHKFRNGYFINHDTLIPVDPAVREKLIFYFIAEQVPQKLGSIDRVASTEYCRNRKIGIPRALCMTATLFAPLAYFVAFRRNYLKSIKSVSALLFFGGLMTPFAGSLFSRVYEARFVENSEVIDQMAKRYGYGIYDFSVAKKQAHILQLLKTLDTPYKQLHVNENDENDEEIINIAYESLFQEEQNGEEQNVEQNKEQNGGEQNEGEQNEFHLLQLKAAQHMTAKEKEELVTQLAGMAAIQGSEKADDTE